MEALRKWRKGQGITADEAARQIGVSRVHWLRMENGTRNISAENLLTVERVTGISRHELRPDLSRIFVDRSPTPSHEERA